MTATLLPLVCVVLAVAVIAAGVAGLRAWARRRDEGGDE